MDSTLGVGSAALASAGARRGVLRAEGDGKGKLPRLVSSLLDAHGLAPRDLGAIVVGTGPGRFTGVRSAVAVAKGLAWGLGVPLAVVGSLEALAAQGSGQGDAWTVLGDGPRNLYLSSAARGVEATSVELAAFVEARVGEGSSSLRIEGASLAPLREALREAGCSATVVEYDLDAAGALTVALRGARVVAVHEVEPTYLREASITPPKVAPPLLAFR